MNNAQEYGDLVNELLATYSREHPFVERSEHTGERGLLTEHYRDASTYNQACCEWVQQQMQQQGVIIHVYRLSKGQRVQNTTTCDLTVDNREVLYGLPYSEASTYVLHTMNNHDLYCEVQMYKPESGQELREEYNAMEANDAAEDSTYTPQYSYEPGPFTSERRASSTRSRGTETETNRREQERQG